MIQIENKDCTGCKMCGDICPTSAISFSVDKGGFWYPKVNSSKCIGCGLCENRCPSLNMEKNRKMENPIIYSAWSKQDDIRISSTSGGVFYELAARFIENGGYVVGCAYHEDWKSAFQMLARNKEDLERIKGSKYFQSDSAKIYKEVKEELENGKEILFCGTPCQLSAIRMFLGKEYKNLYLIDFICRSINSPYAFRKYIEELEEKFSSKTCEVQLKNKKYGWQSLASRVKFENGQESIKDKNSDWWVKGFIYNDLYTRESCYYCKYKELPRFNADITIGDFWGIKNQSKENLFKGISVIMISSQKGKELVLNNDNLELVLHSLEDVLPGNPALLHNPVKTMKEQKFFQLLETHSFSKAVKICTRKNVFTKIKNVLYLAKKVFCKVTEMFYKYDVKKFIYYNFLSKKVIREKGCYLLPYHNVILDLHKTSRIYIYGQNFELGINKLKGSKAETHLRMREGAELKAYNGGLLFYNTVLEIQKKALFESGFFSMNGGSVIICAKHIRFGNDVMLGRNIIIYDSDYHQVLDNNGNMKNFSKEVIIGDHVWLTNQIMVLKGVTIGAGTLVSPYTVVRKDLPKKSMIVNGASAKVIGSEVEWSRNQVTDIG